MPTYTKEEIFCDAKKEPSVLLVLMLLERS